MSWNLSQFHFIRPLWLLAIPAAFVLWLLMSRALKTTYWEAHLNKEILEALRVNTSKQSSIGRWLLLFGWMLAALATAGPTWQKQPVPSFQNNSAMVIALDLSVSMLAEDLTPNRLAQAKYKLIDILRERSDGQTALIAYSGDAHTVTPLTDDPNAIEVLLPALHPSIMPIKGSNTEEAIELAEQLLNDTGNSTGDILLITDGIAEAAQSSISKSLNSAYSLSILGVGSNEAVPIPLEGGGFLRRANGEIILSSLDNQQLAKFASQTNGRYSQIQINGSDVNYLINDEFEAGEASNTASTGNATLYDNWIDMGHWLVILLLPLAALCFRKGLIYFLPLCIILPSLMLPNDANAFEWQDLWQTKDQQAQDLITENPEAAATIFEREDWAGVANYQAKNYPGAAEKFAAGESASDHYNRGNALALSGDLPEAIQAYDHALELEPDDREAQYNKEIVEQLLEQQEQQQENQDQGDQQEQSDEDSEDSEQQDSEESEPSDEESQEQQPDQDSEQQSEEQSEQESQEQADSEDTSEDEEQTADEEQSEEQSEEESQEDPSEEEASATLSEATPDQLQDASEQWLRGIQNDPSGLLRRKFEYQSQLRSRQRTPTQINPSDERY